MNAVERYIRHATCGLNGQARRDARAELRGAIEDKVWRFTLLGLSEGDAARAALRDLGSPHAIASGLTQVHTLPKAALGAVLAGVACLLGVQALAQVPTVRATSDPTVQFCVYDEAFLKLMTPQLQTTIRTQLAQPGGRAKLEAECRATSTGPENDLLRLADVEAALVAGGVRVERLTNRPNSLDLFLPGLLGGRTLDFMYGVQNINGEPYVATWRLIDSLSAGEQVPLRLTGIINPVLEIGPAKLQLGTAEAPVRVTNLYASPLTQQLSSALNLEVQTDSQIAWRYDGMSKRSIPQLKVKAPDDSLYVLLVNVRGSGQSSPQYLLQVAAVKNGLLPNLVIGLNDAVAPLVNSPKDLLRATAAKKPALLVYKLDASDLRFLKLTPVSASAFTVLPAR